MIMNQDQLTKKEKEKKKQKNEKQIGRFKNVACWIVFTPHA